MGDVWSVLSGGLRLLGRHWPALLTLAFVGGGLRAADGWAAVHVSSRHHVYGQLLLVLAPVCYLLAVVAMFAVCRTSLPRLVELGNLTARDMPSERRPERLVDVAASVLIPFLAVYEAYGLVEEDLTGFRNAAAADEVNHLSHSAGRVGLYPVHVALLVVVGAWVLRWVIGLIERTSRLLVLAYVGALADVFYTVQLAFQAVVLRTRGVQWLQDRVALHWLVSGYERLLDALGFLSGPFDGVLAFGLAVVASWDALVIVPIAWIGVGAVVLARQEADEEAEGEDEGEEVDGEEVQDGTERDVEHTGPPWPVRVVLSLVADVRKRLAAIWGALRLMSSGGLVPMLTVSLVLLLVIRLPVVLTPLLRSVVGPVSTDTYLAFSPIEDSVELALSITLAVPLVAAAVEWLVTRRLSRRGLLRDLDRRTGDGPVAGDAEVPVLTAGQETGSAT